MAGIESVESPSANWHSRERGADGHTLGSRHLRVATLESQYAALVASTVVEGAVLGGRRLELEFVAAGAPFPVALDVPSPPSVPSGEH
jgi:hypothetical protein